MFIQNAVSHQTDFEQITTSFTKKYLRMQSVLFRDNPVFWSYTLQKSDETDREQGAHSQIQKYSLKMQRIRHPLGAQTGKRCQD